MTRVQLQARLSPFGEFEVVAITPGEGNGLLFPAAVLETSVHLWEGVSLFVDHDPCEPRHRLQDLGGVFHNAHWTGSAIAGQVRTTGPKGEFVNDFVRDWLEDVEAGRPTADLGLSADLLYRSPDGAMARPWSCSAHQGPQTVSEITRVLSLDLVLHPARGGAILRALNSYPQGGLITMLPEEEKQNGLNGLNGLKATGATGATGEEGGRMNPGSPIPPSSLILHPSPTPPDEISGEDLARAQCGLLLDMALRASDLPDPSQTALRTQFANRLFRPTELQTAIEQQRHLVTALRPSPVTGNPARNPIAGMAHSGAMMWSDLDRLQLAVQRDIFGARLPGGSPDVPRLHGLRELYALTTGDVEMNGAFDPSRTQLAAITTGTMAGVVKNAINKLIVERWADLGRAGYLWWSDIVEEQDFASVQDVDWVNVGGIADLPSVAEAETYDELGWSDQTETQAWSVKGGIIALTWQMIDRDEVQRLRIIPRLLATAGIRTLSGMIAGIFTTASGTGPTLDFDSGALFQAAAGRGNNLITTALSYDAWQTARQAMFKQTEINSAKRLGIYPRFCLVPVELQETALSIARTNNKPDTANFHANLSFLDAADVRTVPEWTDANDWAAVADPAIYPCLGVGYRFGRQPQVVEEVPNTGGSFTNRTYRFRVDYVVNVGVIDFRGLFKSNVA